MNFSNFLRFFLMFWLNSCRLYGTYLRKLLRNWKFKNRTKHQGLKYENMPVYKPTKNTKICIFFAMQIL